MLRVSVFMSICIGLGGVAEAGIVVVNATSSLTLVEDFTFPHNTVYDTLDGSPVFQIGESFSGQAVAEAGGYETVTGVPSGPLQLQAPVNGGVIAWLDELQGLSGGSVDPDDIGEGAISILFMADTPEMGLTIALMDSGTTGLAFYGRDGTLIDSVGVSHSGSQDYTFSADDALSKFAGVVITNVDTNGISIDNLHVPEPSTLALAALGLLGMLACGRRRRR